VIVVTNRSGAIGAGADGARAEDKAAPGRFL